MITQSQIVIVIIRAGIGKLTPAFQMIEGMEFRPDSLNNHNVLAYDFGEVYLDELESLFARWTIDFRNVLEWLQFNNCAIELDIGVFCSEDMPMISLKVPPGLLLLLGTARINLIMSTYLCDE